MSRSHSANDASLKAFSAATEFGWPSSLRRCRASRSVMVDVTLRYRTSRADFVRELIVQLFFAGGVRLRGLACGRGASNEVTSTLKPSARAYASSSASTTKIAAATILVVETLEE